MTLFYQCFLSLSLFLTSFTVGLRKHDVCFLITVRPNLLYGTRFDRRQPFVEQTGLVYVRGCEVQGMLDDQGRVIEEGMLMCVPAYTQRHMHQGYNIHPHILRRGLDLCCH